MNKIAGKLGSLLLTLMLGLSSEAALAAVCDVDNDGDVDRNDVNLIFAARNTPVSDPSDPRDADGDGIITVLDGRICVTRCTLSACAVVTPDVIPPQIEILSPADGAVVGDSLIMVNGTATDDVALSSVSVNGIPATVGGGTFSITGLPLIPGVNVVTAVALDTSGNSASTSIQVTFAPNQPPQIEILSPANGAILSDPLVTVNGTATDDVALSSVSVNGIPATFGGGTFSVVGLPLVPGGNNITAEAIDNIGLSTTTSVQVTFVVPNQSPSIVTSPITTATENQLYTYDVDATDADGDTLTFSLDTAPAGMSIDPLSGLIQWTPSNAQIGLNPVGVRAEDGNGGIATQSYSIDVAPIPNTSPLIVSTPPTTAIENQLYTYDVDATDADGDTLTFSLDTAPAGMSIDPLSGLIQWTPSNAQIGLNPVGVRADDGNGGIATQSYSIDVAPIPNTSPLIVSTPPTTAIENQLYTYDVDATDADGDTLTFSLDTAPAGMSIDPLSGLIQWMPSNAQIGLNPVGVRAEDGNGGIATQSYSIDVAPIPNTSPLIVSTPPTTATEDQLYTYDVDATDADGDTLTFSLDTAPAGMSIDPLSGLIQWTPSNAQIGLNPVGVRAEDGNGGIATQSYSIDVAVGLFPAPDVVGLPQADAEAAIVAAGLAVGVVSTQSSDTVPAGDVISQIPLPGTTVVAGTPVDLFVSSGPPSNAQLSLSTNVVPTLGAGGSVDADCVVFDSNDQPTGLPVDLSTDDPAAIITGGTNFAFPNVGEFTINCQAIGFIGVNDSDTVVVLDDFIDPLYAALDASLTRFDQLHGDTLVANEGDDIPGLQAAKNGLLAEITAVDLAGLAAAPPVPTGADVPSNAELLAAGDTPDPAVDTPFVDTVQAIRQNMIDYAALLASVNVATITQSDVDAMNALQANADLLANTLETLGDPSSTAVLQVNTELNDIVSNLIPNQAVNVAQLTVDAISTAPGIVYRDWKLDPRGPEAMFAGLQPHSGGPADFYGESRKAFGLVGLLTSTSIANSLRSRYIKTVYKPIMKHIARMANFLRTQNLGPFGLNPPVLDFVFGNGSASSTIFEGGFIQVWGSGFDPVAANNIIEVQSANGTFQRTGVVVQIDSGGFDIMDSASFPSNMGDHPFGLPDVGVVRVITSGGTSNGITVNIFR